MAPDPQEVDKKKLQRLDNTTCFKVELLSDRLNENNADDLQDRLWY